jgi:hypothetical protein
MTDTERRILENQEAILLGLSKLLTPQCKGMLDRNGETSANNILIDCYHLTRKELGKDYIKR